MIDSILNPLRRRADRPSRLLAAARSRAHRRHQRYPRRRRREPLRRRRVALDFLAGLLTGGVLLTVTYSEAIVAPRA